MAALRIALRAAAAALLIALVGRVGGSVISQGASMNCTCSDAVDVNTLLDLFLFTQGLQWSNNSGWGSDSPICTWYGLSCDGSSLLVKLDGNNLNGTIPASWGFLSALRSCSMQSNALTGPIPEALYALTQLEYLNVASNRLTGNPPLCAGLAHGNVVLQDNNFGGLLTNLSCFGSSPCTNTSLMTDIVMGNAYCGVCGLPECGSANSTEPQTNPAPPPVMTTYTQPASTAVPSTEPPTEPPATPVPANISCPCDAATNRSVLMQLYYSTQGPLWSNSTGWGTSALVCDWYGVSCVGEALLAVSFGANGLNGTLPDEFADLSNLYSVQLTGNTIYGTLPSSWSRLQNLAEITVSYPSPPGLSGTIPETWQSMPALGWLSLQYNPLLRGPIPALTRLVQLALDGVSINGPFPEWILNSSITDLTLQGAGLVGALPLGIASHPFGWLVVSNNNLTGNPPTCAWSSSFIPALTNNQFSGFPDESCFGVQPCSNATFTTNVLLGNRFCGVCNLTWCSCRQVNNVTLHGPSLKIFETANITKCCDKCQQTLGCRAAVFFAESSFHYCALKASNGPLSPADGHTVLLI